jgi:hypothetical protein
MPLLQWTSHAHDELQSIAPHELPELQVTSQLAVPQSTTAHVFGPSHEIVQPAPAVQSTFEHELGWLQLIWHCQPAGQATLPLPFALIVQVGGVVVPSQPSLQSSGQSVVQKPSLHTRGAAQSAVVAQRS